MSYGWERKAKHAEQRPHHVCWSPSKLVHLQAGPPPSWAPSAGPPPSWASGASLQPDAEPCWAPGTETVILAQIRHHYLIYPRIGVARTLGIIGENIMFGSCLLTAMCRRSIYSTAPSFCQYQHVILLPLVIFTTATVHDI